MNKIHSLIFSKTLVLVIFISRILEFLKLSFRLVNKAIVCFLEAVFSLCFYIVFHIQGFPQISDDPGLLVGLYLKMETG